MPTRSQNHLAQTGRRSDLEREIRLERNLTISEPRIIGATIVIPLPVAEPKAEPEPVIYAERHLEPLAVNEDRQGYAVGAGSSQGLEMRRDDEIEAVGMRVAMEYERECGWQPEDVSGENRGFDVRSTHYGPDGAFADIRYIEVKARARSGAIRLSANEWKKARQFGDKFWLYVVTETGTDEPQLHRIQNPAACFRMDEDIFATGFIIPESRWFGKSDAG